MNDLEIQRILTRRKLLQLGARGSALWGRPPFSTLDFGIRSPLPVRRLGRHPRRPSLQTDRKTGHLSLFLRRPLPHRHVRLPPGDAQHPRDRVARFNTQWSAITGMTSGQKSFPCVAPMFDFSRHGQNGSWFSELVPNIAGIADEITLVKSVHTEAINHDPAITAINTGVQQPGSHPWALGWTGVWEVRTRTSPATSS